MQQGTSQRAEQKTRNMNKIKVSTFESRDRIFSNLHCHWGLLFFKLELFLKTQQKYSLHTTAVYNVHIPFLTPDKWRSLSLQLDSRAPLVVWRIVASLWGPSGLFVHLCVQDNNCLIEPSHNLGQEIKEQTFILWYIRIGQRSVYIRFVPV